MSREAATMMMLGLTVLPQLAVALAPPRPLPVQSSSPSSTAGGPVCNFTVDAGTGQGFNKGSLRGGTYFHAVSPETDPAATASVAGCAALCCATDGCVVFSLNAPWSLASGFLGACQQNQNCCSLASDLGAFTKNTYAMNITTGVVQAPCRDRLKQPFSPTSIWNTAIGSDAVFVPGNIFRAKPPPAGTDQCAFGKKEPAQRMGCAGWNSSWSVDDCHEHDCCYDPHPNCTVPSAAARHQCGAYSSPANGCTAANGCCYSPMTAVGPWCYKMNASSSCGQCGIPLPATPMSPQWCYTKVGDEFSNASQLPAFFYTDKDYFIATKASDPLTPWYNQGFETPAGVCVRNNCSVANKNCPYATAANNWTVGTCYLCNGEYVGSMPFPHSWTLPGMTSNNAAAVLLPDNETLVQMQPLVRCSPGSPIFSLSWKNFIPNGGSACGDSPGHDEPTPGLPTGNTSILGEGNWGAHGGSRLSSIGGTIRLGELLPDAPPIPHAIKLMLWGGAYYWPGNSTTVDPCYRWPALNCDCWSVPSQFPNDRPPNANFCKLLPLPNQIHAIDSRDQLLTSK